MVVYLSAPLKSDPLKKSNNYFWAGVKIGAKGSRSLSRRPYHGNDPQTHGKLPSMPLRKCPSALTRHTGISGRKVFVSGTGISNARRFVGVCPGELRKNLPTLTFQLPSEDLDQLYTRQNVSSCFSSRTSLGQIISPLIPRITAMPPDIFAANLMRPHRLKEPGNQIVVALCFPFLPVPPDCVNQIHAVSPYPNFPASL